MDKTYWDTYYRDKHNGSNRRAPSQFAVFCANYTDLHNKVLLDVGCGAGEDSEFLAAHGAAVAAMDYSKQVVVDNKGQATYYYGDMAYNFPIDKIDVIYSRFSLHAITAEQQVSFLSNAEKTLNEGGLLFIETRSLKDPHYGVGEEVEKNAFVSNHYRRFQKKTDLVKDIEMAGLEVKYVKASTGFAYYKGEDPKVIRIVACKS
jgi:2-polyprenyl-3-methyl-5-hydroxy-6-metoxy-1,4-benzoquinol methylase